MQIYAFHFFKNFMYIYFYKQININIHIFQDGDRFWRLPECYIRGSMIKYLRIPDEIFDMVKEDIVVNKARGRTDNQKNRAPRGARQGIFFYQCLSNV